MPMSFDRISLLATCICYFAISASHSDCGQLEQCVTDPHGDIWCSLYTNVSTNHLAIMKRLTINESISSATVDDTNVKVYWNTHTQDIFLNISRDYQRARSLDIRAILEGNNLPVHVHVELYNIRITAQTENKQIIVNCSMSGIHNTSNIVEIRFNDEKSFSCRKTQWPNEPEGSTDKPYVRFVDNTTCQLTVPKVAKADSVDYYCRVELQLSPETYKRRCHLLSETITPSGSRESSISIIVIGTAVPVAIVTIIVAIVMVSVVVAKIRKYRCQRDIIAHPPKIDDLHVQFPNVNYKQPVDIPDGGIELSDSGSGWGVDPAVANAEDALDQIIYN